MEGVLSVSRVTPILAATALAACVAPQAALDLSRESQSARAIPVTLSARQSGSVLDYEVGITNTLPTELCFPEWYRSEAPVDVIHQATSYQMVGGPVDEFGPEPAQLAHLRPGGSVSLSGRLDLADYRTFTESGKRSGLVPAAGDAVTLQFRGIFDTCWSGVHDLRRVEDLAKMAEYTAAANSGVLIVTSDPSPPFPLP